MKRYDMYTRFLNYPGDWGERAFRGWLVFEIFHEKLGWPIENIVFGERYDVLFVDNHIKPVIYLETKKPGRGLAELEQFKARISMYQTLEHAVIANGKQWLRIDVAIKNETLVNLFDSEATWRTFTENLLAKNHLYGV